MYLLLPDVRSLLKDNIIVGQNLTAIAVEDTLVIVVSIAVEEPSIAPTRPASAPCGSPFLLHRKSELLT